MGWLEIDRSYNTYLQHAGERLTQPILMFVVEGRGHRILVDTGSPDEEYCRQHQRTIRRGAGEEPRAALKAAGFEPESIDIVVLTHLHWDHAGNVGLVPDVPHIVQREELRYAVAPLPAHIRGYDAPQGREPHVPFWMGPRYQPVDGDLALLADGVSLLHTPGHSPGSQTVLVTTARGTLALAGDTVPLLENWERNLPNTIHVGLPEYYQSLARIRAAADQVLPGHEERVLDTARY